MSNTRPEQRTDRNGKVVTRHVIDKNWKTLDTPVRKKALEDEPPMMKPTVPGSALFNTPASKYGNPVEARVSDSGDVFYVEEAPPNPNQPFRDPLFNVTTDEGKSFEIQQSAERGHFYRGPETYGKSLEALVDWF